MSKYITIDLLVRMLLETLLVLFVVRFDRVYYQHTVVLKNSSRRELLQVASQIWCHPPKR
ncbi:hypothetical protein [Pasteuria penetrans]|uniref:hypothetical protein n=1 Tax=Pasteuria penetrans TaxID=86005 RepID=UPI000FABDB50|nr:hypothetical protein [Pasteuria penetrans]